MIFTAPSPPKNFEVTNDDSDGLWVSWQPPFNEYGIISNYTLKWTLANDDNAYDTATLPAETLEYAVTGLTECELYTFSINANNGAGAGYTSSLNGVFMEEGYLYINSIT